jgi:hypothetical protein
VRAFAVLAVVCLAVVACGDRKPRLKAADSAPLIALTNRISTEGPCGQKRDLPALRRRAIALVNRHAVPSELQEPLLSAVNDLAGRAVSCTPPRSSPAVRSRARSLAAWLEKNSA